MEIREILIPVDLSSSSELAAGAGLALADRLGAHATLLHVVEPLPPMGLEAAAVERYERDLISRRGASLDALLDGARRSRESRATARILRGEVGMRILATASELGAQLIAMASTGTGDGEPFLLGSTAARVVRDARCPVLVLRRDHAKRLPSDGLFRRPLVAIDYSRFSAPAVRLAAALSEPAAAIELYHTMFRPTIDPEAGADRRMFDAAFEASHQEAVHRLDELGASLQIDRTLSPVVEVGRASRTIAQRVERSGIDLVVAGAHGRESSADLLLGSVADRLMRTSAAPVLLIPDRAL